MADAADVGLGNAAFVFLVVDLAVAADLDFAPFREEVDHRDADAVQAAGGLVGAFFEFAAEFEDGHHAFERSRAQAPLAESRRVLMPGHTFLYSPPVVYIKELIDSGDLGELYFISSSRVNLGLHQPDVSVVWTSARTTSRSSATGSASRRRTVSAMSRDCVIPGTPDVAFINLAYASGIVAQVELAWLAPSKLRRTAVVGSERMVVYDDTSGEPVRVFDSGATLRDPETFGEYQLSYRTGDIVSPRVEPVEPLLLQMEDFCRAIRERVEPRSSAAIGREVVEVIEAVDRSLEMAGAPVDVQGSTLLSKGSSRPRSGGGGLGRRRPWNVTIPARPGALPSPMGANELAIHALAQLPDSVGLELASVADQLLLGSITNAYGLRRRIRFGAGRRSRPVRFSRPRDWSVLTNAPGDVRRVG